MRWIFLPAVMAVTGCTSWQTEKSGLLWCVGACLHWEARERVVEILENSDVEAAQ